VQLRLPHFPHFNKSVAVPPDTASWASLMASFLFHFITSHFLQKSVAEYYTRICQNYFKQLHKWHLVCKNAVLPLN